MLGSIGAAHAGPVSWVATSPESGDWSKPANWQPSGLPGATADVTINTVGPATITHCAGTDSINSLTTGANSLLSLNGGSLSIANASVLAGGLTQSGGTLTGTGQVTVSGTTTLTGGTQSGAATTLANGAPTFGTAGTSGSFSLDGNRVLENAGGGKAIGTSFSLDLNPQYHPGNPAAGTFRNDSEVTFDDQTTSGGLSVSASNAGSNASSPLVDNKGTWKKTGSAATSTISTTFNNSGVLDVQSGTQTLGGPVTQYSGTTLTGGTWIVGNGATLQVTTNGAQNLLTNAGDVSLVGPNSVSARINTLTSNTGAFRLLSNRNFTVAGAGTFSNSGLLQLGGGIFSATTLTNTGNVSGYGSLSTANPVANAGGVVTADGGTLALSREISGGTLAINPLATADLSGAPGPSTVATLTHNGAGLSLGANNITVTSDYTNVNFGVGNAFNARANVTGSGKI